jgi:hypothetical protein
MIRHVVAGIALAGTLLIPATHALAAPGGAQTSQTIPLSCDNGQTYTVVVNMGNSGQNGQGEPQTWGPGFVVGGGLLLPISFTFTLTDLTTGAVLFSQTVTKGQAANASGTPLTCTFSLGTEPLPNGDTGQLSGMVVALPR